MAVIRKPKLESRLEGPEREAAIAVVLEVLAELEARGRRPVFTDVLAEVRLKGWQVASGGGYQQYALEYLGFKVTDTGRQRGGGNERLITL